MKLSGSRIAGFLRSPDPKLRLILLYGEDRGLVRERADQLAKTAVDDTADPFRVAELTPEDVRSEPAKLSDELAALSLTGGRRVVFLRMEGEDLSSHLAPLLEVPPPGDSLLVVAAGELGPRAAVRKLFEDSDSGVAIPCYSDGEADIEALIEATFAEIGIAVEPAARDFLVSHLGADRLVTRAELEKLSLYVRGQTTLTLDDAVASVGDSGALSLDKIAFAAAEGDVPALDQHLFRAYREGQGPIAVLRATLRHFQRLHLAAAHMQTGRSADEAMKALRPPVLFLFADRFRRQLRMWSAERLRTALAVIDEAERDCKSTGLPDEAVCHRALLRLGLAAQRAGAR